MISLTQSLSDFDRLEELQKTSIDCYSAAVESTGRNAVEVDADSARRFRDELEALAKKVRAAESAGDLRQTRVSFQGTIEEYAAKAGRYVAALKEKVAATGKALAELLESVQRGSNDERRLQMGLGQLHSIAQDPEITRVCPELVTAVATVEDSVEQLRKRNEHVVAQLQEEIGTLRTALDSAQEAASRDPISGVLNRSTFLTRIREELAEHQGFCIVFVWVANLDYLHRRYGSTCRDGALSAFAKRLIETSGNEANVGRWGEDRFGVLVRRPKPEAIWLAESLGQLTGPYVVKEQKWARETRLRLRTGVTEATPGMSESRLLQAADKLLIALESVATTDL